jgi:hypothetical protein
MPWPFKVGPLLIWLSSLVFFVQNGVWSYENLYNIFWNDVANPIKSSYVGNSCDTELQDSQYYRYLYLIWQVLYLSWRHNWWI